MTICKQKFTNVFKDKIRNQKNLKNFLKLKNICYLFQKSCSFCDEIPSKYFHGSKSELDELNSEIELCYMATLSNKFY